MLEEFAGELVQQRVGTPATELKEADVAAYRAVRSAAAWFECTDRWVSFRGDKAADALNGLVTNDVAALRPGEGLHAAALTPKGKVIADMHVLCVGDGAFLMAVPAAAADGWLALARKYVNPRLAKVTDETDRHAAWIIAGPGSPTALTACAGVVDGNAQTLDALPTWPMWLHVSGLMASEPVRLIRTPLISNATSVMVVADAAGAATVRQQLHAQHILFGSPAVRDVLRVESGRPLWGVDMDENTIPQEANLDVLDVISFSKGCYTGQETVARLHFRGHVNRQLRGLRAASPLLRGTVIVDSNGKAVGDVRSTVISPRFGSIGLAMIRREVAVGDSVQLTVDGESVSASVVALPFEENLG